MNLPLDFSNRFCYSTFIMTIDNQNNEEHILDFVEVMDHINDCMFEAGHEYVTKVYHDVCSGKIEYVGAGCWKVLKED